MGTITEEVNADSISSNSHGTYLKNNKEGQPTDVHHKKCLS